MRNPATDLDEQFQLALDLDDYREARAQRLARVTPGPGQAVPEVGRVDAGNGSTLLPGCLSVLPLSRRFAAEARRGLAIKPPGAPID